MGEGTRRLRSISENLGDFESVPESYLYPCDSDLQASRKQVLRQAGWIQGVRQTAGSKADLAPGSQEKQSQVIGGRQLINPQAGRESSKVDSLCSLMSTEWCESASPTFQCLGGLSLTHWELLLDEDHGQQQAKGHFLCHSGL